MKAVVQRVKSAKVKVNGSTVGEIGPGLLTLLGVAKGDTEEHLKKTIDKILNLRIFEDEQGKLNLSLLDKQYSHLIVSQFTLLGNCQKGRRPSFEQAAPVELAKELYEKAIHLSNKAGIKTEGGQFQAHMEVSLVNDGPVTLIVDF
jgi:D-tyrosyl-tRNA(Tyr) deacylase